MARSRTVVILLVVALLATACAPGVNPEVGTAPPGGDVAGFWLGVWHGVIVPVTFVVSLFTDDVTIYEVRNSGNWYDVGFLLGMSVLGGGPLGASSARRR